MMNKYKPLIILLIILFMIMFIYISYLLCKQSKQNFQITETINFENPVNKTVVLLKTHIWNDSLEKFATKIKDETTPYGIDFYILMHSNNKQLPNKIKNPELKKYAIVFTEAEIKKVYDRGFFSMWLSNHWILMWFYKQHKHEYDYFWTIEYDVRISGKSSKLWRYNGKEDFLYPIEIFQDPNWRWKDYYVGGILTDDTKYYGYLQLARYSNRFLKYLDEYYESGENGQDEMITFSLFKRSGYSGSKNLLYKLINNSWSVDSTESEKHQKLLEESEAEYQIDKHHLRIFHPVK